MLSSLYPALVPKPDSFPVKLYQLVGAAVERGICTWTSNEFVIVNKELLCSSLLPLYFRHCRMDSFQRQLHMCAASSAITRHGSEAGATGLGRARACVMMMDGWVPSSIQSAARTFSLTVAAASARRGDGWWA